MSDTSMMSRRLGLALGCILKEIRRRDISVTAKGYSNTHTHSLTHSLTVHILVSAACLCVKGTGRGTGKYPYELSVIARVDRRNSEGGLTLLPLRIWGLKNEAISADATSGIDDYV